MISIMFSVHFDIHSLSSLCLLGLGFEQGKGQCQFSYLLTISVHRVCTLKNYEILFKAKINKNLKSKNALKIGWYTIIFCPGETGTMVQVGGLNKQSANSHQYIGTKGGGVAWYSEIQLVPKNGSGVVLLPVDPPAWSGEISRVVNGCLLLINLAPSSEGALVDQI